MNTDKLIHPEISEAIIGAAMKVLNTLRPGLDEKAHENALVIELRKRGHKVDQQKRSKSATKASSLISWFLI